MINRRNQICLRLNEKEYARLQEIVKKSGFPREAVLRSMIMDAKVKVHPTDEYIKLIRLLSNLANNINQIAHHATATGYIDPNQMDAAVIMIEKCWNHLKQLR